MELGVGWDGKFRARASRGWPGESAVGDNLGKSSGGRANEMPLDSRVLYDTDPAAAVG